MFRVCKATLYVAVWLFWLCSVNQTGHAASRASSASSKRKSGEIKVALAKPVSLDFARTPVHDVITYLHHVSHINFVLDADREGKSPVTIQLSNTPLATALSLILRQAHLSYVVERHAIYVASPRRIKLAKRTKGIRTSDKALREAFRKPITIDFAGTPLRDVASFLAGFASLNIVVQPQVQDRAVTLNVSSVPLEDCLIYLARLTDSKVKCQANVIVFSKSRR